MASNMRFKEYLASLFHGWVGKMSGIASVVLAFLPLIWPSIFGDSKVLVRATWAGAAVCFVIANHAAWLRERRALEAEEQRREGSEIRGKIKRGYLDIRDYNVKTGGWESIAHGCYVRFWVEAVNHNPCPAFPQADQTTLEMCIDGKSFRGEWFKTQTWLAFQDRVLLGERLIDLFDGRFDPGGWKRGDLWVGYIGFFVKDFDLTDQSIAIAANVKIVITDTLEKSHILEGGVPVSVGKICLSRDVVAG